MADDYARGPIAVTYDDAQDVVLVDGIRYAGDLFRTFRMRTPQGVWLRVVESADGLIHVEQKTEEEIAHGQNHKIS